MSQKIGAKNVWVKKWGQKSETHITKPMQHSFLAMTTMPYIAPKGEVT